MNTTSISPIPVPFANVHTDKRLPVHIGIRGKNFASNIATSIRDFFVNLFKKIAEAFTTAGKWCKNVVWPAKTNEAEKPVETVNPLENPIPETNSATDNPIPETNSATENPPTDETIIPQLPLVGIEEPVIAPQVLVNQPVDPQLNWKKTMETVKEAGRLLAPAAAVIALPFWGLGILGLGTAIATGGVGAASTLSYKVFQEQESVKKAQSEMEAKIEDLRKREFQCVSWQNFLANDASQLKQRLETNEKIKIEADEREIERNKKVVEQYYVYGAQRIQIKDELEKLVQGYAPAHHQTATGALTKVVNELKPKDVVLGSIQGAFQVAKKVKSSLEAIPSQRATSPISRPVTPPQAAAQVLMAQPQQPVSQYTTDLQQQTAPPHPVALQEQPAASVVPQQEVEVPQVAEQPNDQNVPLVIPTVIPVVDVKVEEEGNVDPQAPAAAPKVVPQRQPKEPVLSPDQK